MAAVSAMSVMVQSGLAGVSIQMSRVFPGCTPARIAAGSAASTKLASIPREGASSASHLRRPQYMTFGATTCAGRSSARNVAVAALIPDASTRPAAPPSSAVSTASACRTVALSGRP